MSPSSLHISKVLNHLSRVFIYHEWDNVYTMTKIFYISDTKWNCANVYTMTKLFYIIDTKRNCAKVTASDIFNCRETDIQ